MACSNEIKNIIFDMGGVLVPLNPARCIKAFLALGAIKTAAYVRDFRTEDLFLDIEEGRMTTAGFCEEVRRKNSISAADGEIEAAWNTLLEPSSDECREGLLHLKSLGYRLFLLSNTCDIHWRHASRNLIPSPGKTIGDYFERCFLSFELHCRKPSPAIYAAVLRSAGIVPAETLFIDDNDANLSAAAAFGIRTFHEREGQRWNNALSL